MKLRSILFAFTRTTTAVTILLGGGLYYSSTLPVVALGLIAFGVTKALRLLAEHGDLERHLILKSKKQKAGITRKLHSPEVHLLLLLDTYGQLLENRGGDTNLADSIRQKGWELIRGHQPADIHLKQLLNELPPLTKTASTDELRRAVSSELTLLRAAELEIETIADLT